MSLNKTSSELHSSYKPWLFAIFMGIIGAIINSVPLPLFLNVELILGNAAFVFVAMHLLPKYTLLTAFITVFPLFYFSGDVIAFAVFGLEAWFISSMRRRGWYVLIADMLYWLIAGMPLTFLFIWLNNYEINSYDFFTVLKQAFNGLWYTCLACLLMFIFNEKMKITWQHQSSSHRTLRAKLMYSFVFITIAALFTATLLISHHFITASKSFVVKSLHENSESVAKNINVYFEQNKQTVGAIGDVLSTLDANEYQSILTQFSQRYADFANLRVVDATGQTKWQVSQAQYFNGGTTLSLPVIKTSEYQRVDKAVYISPAFYANSDSSVPYVALTAYFSTKQNKNTFYAIEAILDLSILYDFTLAAFQDIQTNTVIIDKHQNLIYASPTIHWQGLNKFEYTITQETNKVLTLSAFNDREYIFQQTETNNHWQVFILVEQNVANNHIKDEYLMVFIILFFTLIATAYFADQYGQRLTKPIDFIIEQLMSHKNTRIVDEIPNEISASSEVYHLYQEIIDNRDQLYRYQESLEEKVVERTQELNLANKQLEQLALYDGLTKVHNRRYLDDNFVMLQKSADRNTALMALIMIDLDHFKQLNDTYGHLVGDNCLVKVAELIKQSFDRGSDMVVRFGGEEFVVVAPYITPVALKQKLEALRELIASEVFHVEPHELFSVTASLGAVIADACFSSDVLKWVKEADECLYEAKNAGRNRFIITDKVTRVSQ